MDVCIYQGNIAALCRRQPDFLYHTESRLGTSSKSQWLNCEIENVTRDLVGSSYTGLAQEWDGLRKGERAPVTGDDRERFARQILQLQEIALKFKDLITTTVYR